MEVYNSLRGTRCKLDQVAVTTFDTLRHTLSVSEGIELAHLLLLMSPSGHQLKPDNMEKARKVFLFDKSWALDPKQALNSLHPDGNDPYRGTNPTAKTILLARDTALEHLKHIMAVANKQLNKLKAEQQRLSADLKACQDWSRSWHAQLQVPELGEHLPTILNREKVAQSHEEMMPLWSINRAQLVKLATGAETVGQKVTQTVRSFSSGSSSTIEVTKEGESVEEARNNLISTLQTVSEIQGTIVDELRKPLAAVSDGFKRINLLKTEVAQVIDLPFVFGVLKIEAARRRKWEVNFQPLRNREILRRKKWQKHYCEGPVGQMVAKLERHGGTNLGAAEGLTQALDQSLLLDDATMASSTSSTAIYEDVEEYIGQLEALGLDYVCKDLRHELEAMQRQLYRSILASISSLLPTTNAPNTVVQNKRNSATLQSLMTPQRMGPDRVMGDRAMGERGMGDSQLLPQFSSPNNNEGQMQPESATIAAYEARIRKFEMLLMQSHMSTKSHELDIVRAETRAEARAETKAEFKAEQQQLRINELEEQNLELLARLLGYTASWENVLNSMGLQTSRVDTETGEEVVYRVNRVKGLSRKHREGSESSGSETNGPVASGATANITSTNAAATTTAGTGSSPSSSLSLARYNYHKIMGQTFIDTAVLFEATSKRFGDVERLARKLQGENKNVKDQLTRIERECRQRVALRSFKVGDLILFLPTRDQQRQPNPWAAFNAHAPHYFLHPRHAQQLNTHEYLLARATSIEKHVVDDVSANPFDLPRGVEWFFISIEGEWAI